MGATVCNTLLLDFQYGIDAAITRSLSSVRSMCCEYVEKKRIKFLKVVRFLTTKMQIITELGSRKAETEAEWSGVAVHRSTAAL